MLGRRVDLRASIAIRGASGNRSAIVATHTDTVFYLSRSTSWGSPIPIGGAVAGATSLTVADLGGLSAGDYVRIEQEDDPEWVDLKGCDGECSWCGECAGGQGHNCAMAQMSRVTSVQGHGEVALARPLFWGFALRPQLVPITMLEGAGIEQLYIRRTQPAEAETVLLKQCAGCWVRDIESADAECGYQNAHGELPYFLWTSSHCRPTQLQVDAEGLVMIVQPSSTEPALQLDNGNAFGLLGPH